MFSRAAPSTQRAPTPAYVGSATQWEYVSESKLTLEQMLLRYHSRQRIHSFPRFVRYLLCQCLHERPDDVTVQVKQTERAVQLCLEAATSIANGETFRKDMIQYCESKTAQSFLELVNHALQALHTICPLDEHGKILLRTPRPFYRSIMAVRLDHEQLDVSFGHSNPDHSPDVMLATLSDVSDSCLGRPPHEDDRVLPSSLAWAHVKFVGELKSAPATNPVRPGRYCMDDPLAEFQPFLGGLLAYPSLSDKVLAQVSSELEPTPPLACVSDDTDYMLEHENSPTWHPDAQLAVYAAERFRCLPCVNHDVGMVLQDDVIWLFWHDRQGVIQSTGISFVRNAPHFLLVLLAMQRFNSVDWGVPEGFPEQTPTNDLVLLPGSSPEDGFRVNWREVLHRSSGLTGRCAQVFRGTRKTSGVVVKISHRDKSRLTEDYIVKRVRDEAESMKFPLKSHLPVCLFSCDLRHDSAWIREFLNGSADGLSASRIPRITVWETLLPIYQLPAADFVRCWLEVIHAHRVLWEKGIRHLNPSLANTMVRMVEGKSRGVLNDWELATICGESRHDASELTGNWLFMAVELMTDEGLRGDVPRLYRYDLEGFTWILPWVFLQYDEENTVHETDQTWLWKSSSLDNARNAKEDFLVVARGCKPQEKWKDQWALAERMRRIFARINITGRMVREVEALFGHTALGQQGDTSVEDDEELSDEDMYNMFWEEIDGYYQSLGTAGLQELSAIREYCGLPPTTCYRK